MTDTPALSLAALSKTFPGTRALDSVSLDIEAGEIHALVGQNGSGKSTLIKILAGFHQPDPHAVGRVRGKPFPLGDAAAARRAGLRFVHQDLALVGQLNTVENLALGFGYSTGLGKHIKWREQDRRAKSAIESLGYRIDVRRPVDELAVSDRTAVAIARALQDWERNVELLVLDEPTAAMPLPEIDRFLGVVRRVAERGTAVLYVSHHMGEVFDLAHRMTVLRDGVGVATLDVSKASKSEVVQLMTGRVIDASSPGTHQQQRGRSVLSVRGLQGGALRNLDVDVGEGQIVGIAGITGSGRDEVCDLIFGSRPRLGTVEVDDSPLPPAHPKESVTRGMGLVPANRHRDGLLLSFSVRENLTLPDLSPFWHRLIFGKRAEVGEARRWIERMQVKTPSTETPVESLSGGNQQKVVLAKWLRVNPRLLLLDEPTQGVDVAATAEIHGLIREAAASGAAILVGSSDEEELAVLCSTVLVLRSGAVAKVLTGKQVNASSIIAASLDIDVDDDGRLAQEMVQSALAEGGIGQ